MALTITAAREAEGRCGGAVQLFSYGGACGELGAGAVRCAHDWQAEKTCDDKRGGGDGLHFGGLGKICFVVVLNNESG